MQGSRKYTKSNHKYTSQVKSEGSLKMHRINVTNMTHSIKQMGGWYTFIDPSGNGVLLQQSYGSVDACQAWGGRGGEA